MKHELSTTWKKILISALAVLAVAVMGIGTLIVIQVERHRSDAPYDEVLYRNDRIEMVGRYKQWHKQYTWMRDAETGKTMIKRFRWFGNSSNPNDSIVVICDWNNERGYINLNTGERIIPAQYSHAWNFSEGLGAVVRNGRLGFVNMQGEEVIPCQFEVGEHSIHHLGFAFHDSLCVMTNERNQCGIINREGKWVVAPQYDCIWNANNNGLRIYQNDGLYGLMNQQGNIIQTAQYDGLCDYEDFFEVEKDGVRYTMGYDLQVIQPFVCDHLEEISYSTDDGYYITSNYMKYYIGAKEGVIDQKGQVVIPAKYDIVSMINSNLFKANLHNTNLWILLDSNGKVVP